MNNYIDAEVSKFADPGDQKQLASYIREDLDLLGSHNIVGMGVTIEQVQNWRAVKEG